MSVIPSVRICFMIMLGRVHLHVFVHDADRDQMTRDRVQQMHLEAQRNEVSSTDVHECGFIAVHFRVCHKYHLPVSVPNLF